MKDFDVGREPPVQPVGMKIVGVGIIASCLLLSVLFAWGIYLNLTQEPCSCPQSTPAAAPSVPEGQASGG